MNKFYLVLATSLLLLGISVHTSAQVTEDYEYDPLGRLTIVKENGSTKTGYCYDEAGNRSTVTQNAGGGDDCLAPPPPLLPPTGLTIGTHQGGLVARWNSVSGATHYLLRVGSNILTVNDVSYYASGQVTFHYVRACNSTFCSDYAYF